MLEDGLLAVGVDLLDQLPFSIEFAAERGDAARIDDLGEIIRERVFSYWNCVVLSSRIDEGRKASRGIITVIEILCCGIANVIHAAGGIAMNRDGGHNITGRRGLGADEQ